MRKNFPEKQKFKEKAIVEPLEPRILFSADWLPTVADAWETVPDAKVETIFPLTAPTTADSDSLLKKTSPTNDISAEPRSHINGLATTPFGHDLTGTSERLVEIASNGNSTSELPIDRGVRSESSAIEETKNLTTVFSQNPDTSVQASEPVTEVIQNQTINIDENSDSSVHTTESTEFTQKPHLDAFSIDSDQTSYAHSPLRKELIFIDETAPGHQAILRSIYAANTGNTDYQIVSIENSSDGIAGINQTLAVNKDIAALHLISHNSKGSVSLGNIEFNLDYVNSNMLEIASWNDALSYDARLIIHGADDSTSSGKIFARTLADVIGAEVTLSDNSNTIETGSDNTRTPTDTLNDARRLEYVFIDPAVEDANSLLELTQLDSPTHERRVVWLNAESNGIDQIATALSRATGVDAIHLLSHGDGKGIQLGSTFFDLETSKEYAANMEVWGLSLAPDADLLIYGCDLASTDSGQSLIEFFSASCDCDVAASNDTTGHITQGGDWNLEYRTGAVSTDVVVSAAAQQVWQNTLDITSDLVIRYTFDSDASDGSGNNLDGVLQDNASIDTTSGTNKLGSGKLSLDGTGDNVSLDSNISNVSGLTEGTIAAWIRTSSLNHGTIFGASDSADPFSLMRLSIDGGNLKWLNLNDAVNNVTVTSTAPINDGNWHHVAVTVDSTGNTIYIDGLPAASSYTIGDASINAFFSEISDIDAMTIGQSERNSITEYEFQGLIDDFRLYSRALNAADINELYVVAPILSAIEGSALGYDENDGAVAITSSIALNDDDDTNLESGSVEIISNYTSGEDY
ncbi:hypothetical protein AB833_24395 [Chromatiales bacterium (ex Bugula neritina AB1)]|nr:hypothetical protein AB833_24395 [Chromatiales bacterium (ex Bugula neritina AB1)]